MIDTMDIKVHFLLIKSTFLHQFLFGSFTIAVLQYEQLEIIGRGSFGEVYKCRDREKNTFVSKKRILFRYQDDGVPGSVIREVALLKELDHPNIIR